MGNGYVLAKRYINHKGLDLKSTDLVRLPEFASGGQNTQYRKSGAVDKRPGSQICAESAGGLGAYTYNRILPSTGVATATRLNVGQTLYKEVETTLTVSYGGSDPTALISIFFDEDTEVYRCQLTISTGLALDQALGVGRDETSPFTVANLASAINLVADFTASVSGTASVPAAFLKTTRDHDLTSAGSALVAKACQWEAVNTTVTNPFNTGYTNRNTDDFENASMIQLNNLVFIANGYDEIHKFDGQTVYRAGVPTPASLTSAIGAAGAITGSNYLFKAQMIQVDAVGNVVEGNVVTTSNLLSPAGQRFTLTVANVQAGTGFNTNCAIVAGAQSTVTTITVDDGSGGTHTMKVGDTAYFYDSVSASYVERSVTAITATTISISGAAVTVADNAVISNNLRIGLFRSKTSGSTPTLFYLIAEIPNNSFAATQTYDDNKTDAQLGALFEPPTTDRSVPPKGKYLASFRNLLVVGRLDGYPYQSDVSDVDGPEYFNATGANRITINPRLGDPVSGVGINNELFAIFTKRQIDIVSGDVTTGNFRVDTLTTDIGCVAHATIQELRGTLAFLSDRGPYKMVGGQVPTPLGESPSGGGRLEPLFDQPGVADDFIFVTKRAVAFNNRVREQYWLFLPCESTVSGNVYANTNSAVYVYDYAKDAWLPKWTNINAAGGFMASGEDFHWIERRRSPSAFITSYLYRQRNLNDAFDYLDHTEAIDGRYAMQWEALGEPSVLKQAVRAKIFALEEIPNNDNQVECDVETNYISDTPLMNFTFQFSGGGYGVSEYSTAPYGDPSENTSIHKLGGSRVKSIRLIFKNDNRNQDMIVTGWEMEFAPEYRPRLKT